MLLQRLAAVSDQMLLSQTKVIRGHQNQMDAEMLLHLYEIDKRGIYRDAGYSSLFAYCHHELGFSEGAAGRRVRAARSLEATPEIYELIRDGKLSLSALSEVAPVMTVENKKEVLEAVKGASKREAVKVAVALGAPEKPRRESVRPRKVEVKADLFSSVPKVEERYALSFEVSRDVHELFETAQNLAGYCGIAELFGRALKEYVAKRRPEKVRARSTPPAKPWKKYVSKPLRREVMKRDGFQCSFVSADGIRCCERRGLEIDHIVPNARGGETVAENLRVLCWAHNQLSAEQVFGKAFMQQHSAGGAGAAA